MRPRSTRRSRPGPLAALCLALLASLGGCSDPTGVEIDPAVEPLAGTWEGTSVVLTNKEDVSTSFDLIEQGGTFTLDIQRSGFYTAILTYFGQPGAETGRLSVVGNVVTLNPDNPNAPTTSGIFELQGTTTLIVDGETEFDFNRDGVAEEAFVHLALTKQ